MTSRAVIKWTVRACAVGAALLLFGCSSGKPYALVAQIGSGAHLVVGTIEVSDGQCHARFASLDWADFYNPDCKIMKDQSGFKSFDIDGKQIDFGAVDNGFKVLSQAPKLPGPTVAAAPAAATGKAAAAAKPATTAPAAGTAAPAVGALGEDFPAQWVVTPNPGNLTLGGQNPGYLLASNKLVIQGSDGTLDVTFKAAYKPMHLKAIVVTDEKGDFRLVFNPHITATVTSGGNYDVQLISEGAGISGNIWDSHGFDSWTPEPPPSWSASLGSQGQ